jgi:hypothetical protein
VDGSPVTSELVAGARITDGEEGDVDCSVVPSGGGYRVALALAEGVSSFALTATLVPEGDGYAGTGQAGFYHPNAGNVASDTCTVEVLPNQEIGTGKVWGTFDCTQSTKEASPGYTCNFEGAFIAENCN